VQPLQQIEWFGNPRGYNITYYELDSGGAPTGVSKSVTIDDHTANSHILDKLEEWALYQIEMKAFNDVGSSSASPPAIERTRESGKHYRNRMNVVISRVLTHDCCFQCRRSVL